MVSRLENASLVREFYYYLLSLPLRELVSRMGLRVRSPTMTSFGGIGSDSPSVPSAAKNAGNREASSRSEMSLRDVTMTRGRTQKFFHLCECNPKDAVFPLDACKKSDPEISL